MLIKAARPIYSPMSKNVGTLILFDLVSTITDAGPRYAQAYLDISEQYNLPAPTKRAILNELGQRTLKEIIDIHSPGLAADKIPAFMQDCNSACDAMLNDASWVEQLFPDVKETLTELQAQGYRLGLYTGTRKEAAVDQLRYHQLETIFPEGMIRAKDNITDEGKNSETIKLEQIGSLIRDNPAKHIVVVGDSVTDYHAARNNGASFIGFANTPKDVFHFANAGVTAVFTRYERLAGLIKTALNENAPGNSNAAPAVTTARNHKHQ